MKFRNLLLFFSVLALSSCSVVMAAKKEGTSIDKLQDSRTRAQVLSYGPAIISSERNECGELIEVYQFKKEQGSAARAFMHGMLDVSTFGIWEVVGTPIEAAIHEERYYIIKIRYDQQEQISAIELM